MKHLKKFNEEIDKDKTKNYMFFNNLKTIKRLVDRMLEMDESEVDSILTNGHNWAVDHIATSKDDIEEVFNFFAGNSEEAKLKINENVDDIYVNVDDITSLKIDDVVYYKRGNDYIKGFIGDDFGDGKFFIFDKKIRLEADYFDTHFELYQDERPELQRNIYRLRSDI